MKIQLSGMILIIIFQSAIFAGNQTKADAPDNSKYNNKLWDIIQSSNAKKKFKIKRFKKIIEKHKPNLNTLNEELCGWALLHYASFYGMRNYFNLLLEKGAKPAIRTKRGDTPLHFISSARIASGTQILLDRGVNVNEQNNAGATALHVAGHSTVVEVLNNAEANPNLFADKNVHYPVFTKFHELDEIDMTPLMMQYGVCQSNTYMAHLENPDIDFSITDNHGHNLLHWASSAGCLWNAGSPSEVNMIAPLIGKVEINQLDNYGQTPLDYAKYNKVAEYLRSKGAKLSSELPVGIRE
ncbi:ankyrin repeat domain-containing protein [Bacteriovoracaceae bacterium]|nr:ankyrin repeat domain-containing protein [Bacteriovoracaceae bacterium]